MDLALFLFQTMQLANFGSGCFLIMVAVPHLWAFARRADRPRTIEMLLAELALVAAILGLAAVTVFWRRLADKMVVWFGYDMHNGATSVVAMLLLFGVIWWFHHRLSRYDWQTSAMMAALVLVGSLGLTGLEWLQ